MSTILGGVLFINVLDDLDCILAGMIFKAC